MKNDLRVGYYDDTRRCWTATSRTASGTAELLLGVRNLGDVAEHAAALGVARPLVQFREGVLAELRVQGGDHQSGWGSERDDS